MDEVEPNFDKGLLLALGPLLLPIPDLALIAATDVGTDVGSLRGGSMTHGKIDNKAIMHKTAIPT